MQETQVQSMSQGEPLEKGMATHSSILSWRILWMRILVGYSPWGHKESDMTWFFVSNYVSNELIHNQVEQLTEWSLSKSIMVASDLRFGK